MTMPPRLIIDPAVYEAVAAAVEYWQTVDEGTAAQLAEAFLMAYRRIGMEPERGLRVPGLPANYRRARLARKLPGYIFTYRMDPGRTLLFLLRHERQRPYAPATIQRKASEAARRAEQAGE
jgi:plasmid stabilization system protein ParE